MTLDLSRVTIEPLRPSPASIIAAAREKMTNLPAPSNIAVLLMLLATALILKALWRRYGRTSSARMSRSRNSPFSMTALFPKATATATTNEGPRSEPLDLTRLNPDADDNSIARFGFTPGDVSPETNAPMTGERIAAEFFFMKERLGTVERQLGIRDQNHGRFR